MYESTLAGISDAHAIAATKPIVKLLASKDHLNYPLEFSIRKGSTEKDLQNFAGDIDAGKCSLGVMWGLEYGWMRDQRLDLTPLVFCSIGIRESGMPIHLFVRDEFRGKKLADLKQVRLATYGRFPMMSQIWLMSLVREAGKRPDEFLKVIEFPTPKDAIFAVRRGDADCVVLGNDIYRRFKKIYPNADLHALLTSPHFPPTVLVGNPVAIDKLRPNLWKDLQHQFTQIHNSAEGRRTVEFYSIEMFLKADRQFQEVVFNSQKQFRFADVMPLPKAVTPGQD
jgi:ABC-type phosphate/phosphonate transport system substrate-binding protein